ncbi:peptidase domain-containing ABC transporter [Cysteiniphilum halobium]|uniref:peptidase domain-containing ABC transporter n=1 Tax=Cysteiniphilum halobium TaxID=2219059 RepID=UPI003F830B06
MIKSSKTPIILQMESVECGAASVCIILGFYGCHVSLDLMRKELQVSRDGTSVKNIIDVMMRYNIQANAKLYSIEKLKKHPSLPAIIFWDNCHFLVLEKYKNGFFYLNDPACGRIRVTQAYFEKYFSYIVIDATLKEGFQKQKKQYKEEKYLYDQIKTCWSVLSILMIIILFYSMASLSVPLFGRVFIDDYLIKGAHEWLLPMVGIMVFIALLQFILTAITQGILRRFNYNLLLSSNYRLTNKMFHMPVSFFNQRHLGDLTGRHNSNTIISSFISYELYIVFQSIFQMLIFGIALYFLSLPILIIVIGFIIIDYIYYYCNQNYSYEKNIAMQIEYSKFASYLESSIQSIETVKATGQEEQYYAQWYDALVKYLNQLKSYERQSLKIQNFTEFLSQAKPIIILSAGGFLVHAGMLTIGGLVAFTFLSNYIFQSSEQLFQVGFSWQQTKANITRIIDIINAKIDQCYLGTKTKQDNSLNQTIVLNNITYGYNKNSPPIIKEFSVSINRGEQVVLMGATGSGKSTLMKILQGIYHPWQGHVLIDGIDISEYKHGTVAKLIGSVDQNLFLFEGTLRENLLLGNYNATDEHIFELIHQIGLDTLLMQYRKGLDMPIKEHGKNISGGQAQLIEIIRAILLNPSVLIMDEATSALDSITIQKVMQVLRTRSTTNIMVSHQPNLIRQSDRIILLDDGKILAQGHHNDLMQSNAYYRELFIRS